MAIRARAPDEATAHRAVDLAFARIAHVHATMSFQSPGSDLAAIAAAKPGATVPLDDDTRACLALALDLATDSGGAFDPVLPGGGATWRDLRLQRGGVNLARSLRLDLSGIAKGYAVDRGCEALRLAGVEGGVVNAGGDLRAFGPNPETVRFTPRHTAPAAAVLVQDAALASSDVADATARHGAQQHRDGRNGGPLAAGFAAVSAPDCATADALTKVLLALGEEAAPLLRARGAQAWLHREGGDWIALDSEGGAS